MIWTLPFTRMTCSTTSLRDTTFSQRCCLIPIHPCFHSPMFPFTCFHSPMFPFTRLSIHPCFHSRVFIHPCSHSHVFPFTHVPIHMFPFTCSHSHIPIHTFPFTHVPIHPCSHSRLNMESVFLCRPSHWTSRFTGEITH